MVKPIDRAKITKLSFPKAFQSFSAEVRLQGIPFFLSLGVFFDCRKFLHQEESRKEIDHGVMMRPLMPN